MCCQHFADMTVFTLKLSCGQRETVTAFHKFELKFFDTVNEDLIEGQWDFHRRIPCCQEPLGFSQRWKRKLEILKTWGLQRGPQALPSRVLGGMEREHRNVSLSTPLPHTCYTLIILQDINELSVKCFRVNNFFSWQCMKIEYQNLLTLFLGYWGFSGYGELRGGGITASNFQLI